MSEPNETHLRNALHKAIMAAIELPREYDPELDKVLRRLERAQVILWKRQADGRDVRPS